MGLAFAKYEACGNDYLLVDARDVDAREGDAGGGDTGEVDAREVGRLPALARALCDRRRGIGADGLVVAPAGPPGGGVALRTLNSDGSECKRSGNGLAVYGLHRRRGGTDDRGARCLLVTVVALGNVYHVVPVPEPPAEEVACLLGVMAVRHPSFPDRVNLQLMTIRNPARIALSIWESGAGHVLGSAGGACAAAIAAHEHGAVGDTVDVEMPGGVARVELGDGVDFITVPVRAVATGTVADDLLTRSVTGG